MHKISRKIIYSFMMALLVTSLLAGCNFPTPVSQSPVNVSGTPESQTQPSMVTFRATLTQPLSAGDSVYMTLLDEVTGLAFNSHKYVMNAEDSQHYSISLPFSFGKVIKYRYTREGASVVNEHLYNDRPVRYRLYRVEGPATVEDVITQWTDTEYLGPRGRIMGAVTDSSTGQPVPNLLVTAGGEQAITLADGSFLLDGLPPGTHNLVFYAMDGLYNLYQQGAVVAADSTTPVSIQLKPASLVTVIFTVEVPTDTPEDAPLRLAGSLYQLGNTFTDLLGGVSSLVSRMPTLGRLPDGRYMATLSLPANTYVEYKYTLGDGLWSAEETSDGTTRLRQLILPTSQAEVNDVVESWHPGSINPIRFQVKVPIDTPKGESISIQFNPGFGWLEPLPMRSATNAQGEVVWRFDLTGPFNDLSSLRYRYCRQNQCGSADDASTPGIDPVGRETNPAANPGTIEDEVLSWAYLSEQDALANVPGVQVTPRENGFLAGVSLQSNYRPSWEPLISPAINDLQSLGINWLILSPTWTFTNGSPPILEQLPSQDMLYPELVSSIRTAQNDNFNIGIFPKPQFPSLENLWWQDATRDFAWWVSFFERYSNFVLHHASVASSTGANTLILGGDWLNPALPGGLLADGSSSNVPPDAEMRWRNLISQVRSRYNGTLAWALPYPEGILNPPPFLDAVDQVYVMWSAQLASQPGASLDDMQAQAAAILDQEILPFQERVAKPIIIAISYPSIDGGTSGCIALLGGGCLDYDLISQPHPDISGLVLNLQVQANGYNAILAAINDRSWISGYVSMGYYPPAILLDKSISIHGKPASGVFWYWTQKFFGR